MLQEKAYGVIGFDDTQTTALEGGIGEWSRRGRGAMSEGNGKPKRTALPLFTDHSNFSLHQGHQLFADGQS